MTTTIRMNIDDTYFEFEIFNYIKEHENDYTSHAHTKNYKKFA